nr:hypothetical protein MBKG4397_2320 [Mycoplasmopsis bovis]
MKRSITKIPLHGKLVLKTGIYITPPFLFQRVVTLQTR